MLALVAGAWLHSVVMTAEVQVPWDFLLVMGPILLILLVPLWLALGRWVFQPLKYLERSNQRVAQGDYEKAAIPQQLIPQDEIGALMRSRNMMLDRLLRDISVRRRAEDALRESEERLKQAQRVANVGSWDFDMVTGELHWSEQMYRLHGLSPGDRKLTPDLHLSMVCSDDKELLQQHMAGVLAGVTECSGIKYRLVLPDGQERWVKAQAEVIRASEGTPLREIGTVIDITERKRAEDALRASHERLRSLAVRLQDVREEERTVLAREMHDELGQALTGLKMDLSWLAQRLPQDLSPVLERTQSMASLIDKTIDVVRDLSTRLRPAVLDDLGLVAAIE